MVSVPPIPRAAPLKKAAVDCTEQSRKITNARNLISQNKLKQALILSSELMQAPCSAEYYRQTLELTADILTAKQDRTNAFYFYQEALTLDLKRENSLSLMPKLIKAITPLHPEKIFFLASKISPCYIKEEIIFQAGMAKLKQGKERQDTVLLKRLIEKYPNAARSRKATAVIEAIKGKKQFNAGKIGVLLPMTGYYKEGGQRTLTAVHLALDTLKDKNRFKIMVMDTGSDPDQAAEAVQSLNREGVTCIIGPMVTAGAAAIEAQALGIPMITLTQKQGIPDIGSYIFRNFMTPENQVRTGIEYISSQYGFTKYALLYPDDPYGRAFNTAFTRIVQEYGGHLTNQASYQPAQTDFAAQIQSFITGYKTRNKSGRLINIGKNTKKERNKIYKAKVNFEVIFIPDSIDTAAMIAPQLRYHSIDQVLLMGTNLWHSDKLLSHIHEFQDAVFTDGFDPETLDARQFISRFEEGTGKRPGYMEAAAFDTTLALIRVLSENQITSRNHLTEILGNVHLFPPLSCPMAFDPQGEPESLLHLFQVQKNEVVMVQSCSDLKHSYMSTK